jgi:hypothetical protein
MRILMILTDGSHGRPGLSLSLDQVVEAYYLLHDSGTEVVVASSRGEYPFIRDVRDHSAQIASMFRRFESDWSARAAISDSLKIEQIYAEDFDGAICIGGLQEPHNTADTEVVLSLIEALLAAGKPVAIDPSEIRLAPEKSLRGLLITGDSVRAPFIAAQSILAILKQPVG